MGGLGRPTGGWTVDEGTALNSDLVVITEP